ncbi:MAG: hypothetical protein L6V93_05395 [Clostridiales bacterium]|nr:MAG: hypothetical protein L6V93_05395 [Clostridiales bacterium]
MPFDELVEKYKDKKSGVLKRAINKARNIAKMLISGGKECLKIFKTNIKN